MYPSLRSEAERKLERDKGSIVESVELLLTNLFRLTMR